MLPEEIREKCSEYLSRCDESGRRPTWQGLAGEMGVTSDILNTCLSEGGPSGEALRMAADAISDRLQQKSDSMSVLAIKQPVFGGFMDRGRPDGEGKLNIVVTVGGKGEGGREAAEYGR